MGKKSCRVLLVLSLLLVVLPGISYARSATMLTESTYIEIHSVAAAELNGRPGIATDGENFFVVWRDTTTGSSVFLGARITPDGVNLDPGGISLGGSSSSSYGIYPAVAFDGANYLVVWADTDGEVYAVRVTSEGVVLDDPALKVTTGASSKLRPVSIAFGGTNYLIAWRNGVDAVKVARVSTSGTIIDGPAGTTIGTGFYPWVAFDGANYLVVWHAWGSGGLDIFGNRISPTNGTVLDGTGFVICGAAEDQDHASVTFNGTNYLVVWHDFRGGDIGYNDGSVYGARVSTNGVVLDSPAIQISDLCRGGPVAVAFDGTNFLVVWQVDYWHVEETELVDVFAQKISTAGSLVGEAIPICTAHGHQWGPRVAFNNVDKYLITWTEGGPYERAYGVWGLIMDSANEAPEILHRDGAIWSSETGWNTATPPYYPGTGYARALALVGAGYKILHRDGAIYDSVNGWVTTSPPYYPGTDYAVDLKVIGSNEEVILHRDGALWSSESGWLVTTPPYYPGTAYAKALEFREDASYVILHRDGAIYDSAFGWIMTAPPYYPGTAYAVDMKLEESGYVILHRDGAIWSTSAGWIMTAPPYYPTTDYARALVLVGDGYKILHKDGAIYDSVDGWNVDTPPYYPGTGYAVDLEVQ